MDKDSIRILLVEDEFITLEALSSILTEMNYSISGDSMDANEALKILEKDETDLVILDINIKGDKDGVWLAKQIKEKYNIPFIFLTAYGDQSTVQRAFECEPYGYLVKPFNKIDIFTAIEVALKNFAKQNSRSKKARDITQDTDSHIVIRDGIFIRDDFMFVKLKIEDILFIKSDKNYLEVNLPGKRHLVRGKLNEFIENLSSENFIQVHRLYVINIEAIDSFGSEFLIVDGNEIPLGSGYKDELQKHITLF